MIMNILSAHCHIATQSTFDEKMTKNIPIKAITDSDMEKYFMLSCVL